MGGFITRERRKPAPRRLHPSPEVEETSQEAPQSRAPSKVDTVKTEPPIVSQPKRAVEYHQELTEEMIEGLTRSSNDSANSKVHKKSVLENWLLRANYKVSPENDALALHKRSMEALATLQARKDRGIKSKPEQTRSNPKSKGQRSRQPPNVEVYPTVPAPA